MKSLFIVAILACLAHLGQMQPGPATTHAPGTTPAAPPTTPTKPPVTTPTAPHTGTITITTAAPPTTPKAAPVTSAPKPAGPTFKDITDRFSSDPRIKTLTDEVMKVSKEIQTIEKVFEMDIVFRNISQLNTVLNQVKANRAKTALIIAEIHSEIASVPVRSYLNRIMQESLRIQTEKYDRFLKWVGLEILGDLSDVSRFESYYYSETVGIVQQLLVTKFMNILVDVYEADKILDDAWKKDPLHGKLEAAAKTQVDKYFQDIVKNAKAARDEVAADYYEELEKIRLDNRELNLLQRMEAEMGIDWFNYAISFTTKYDQLFLRIN